MKYYIELCTEVVELAPDITQDRYVMFDRQFDNLWADQGLNLFNQLVNLMDESDFQRCVRVVTDQGDEVTMSELEDVLDENNVIWEP
jgi:hypothetical protein